MKTARQWRIVGWIAAVVLCSGSIGAAAALRLQNERMARIAARDGLAEERAERFTEVLQLGDDQREAVRAVLERGHQEIRAISAEAASRASLVARRIDDDIRPLLDAEQLRRYERLGEVRQRIRERWKSGERLTPEQREWLRERIEQRYGKRARD